MGDRLARIDMTRKVGAAVALPVGWGVGSPSNTMSPGPRHTSVPSGALIHQTVWTKYTNVTKQTDAQTHRQLSDSSGRTVLHMIAPKAQRLPCFQGQKLVYGVRVIFGWEQDILVRKIP